MFRNDQTWLKHPAVIAQKRPCLPVNSLAQCWRFFPLNTRDFSQLLDVSFAQQEVARTRAFHDQQLNQNPECFPKFYQKPRGRERESERVCPSLRTKMVPATKDQLPNLSHPMDGTGLFSSRLVLRHTCVCTGAKLF